MIDNGIFLEGQCYVTRFALIEIHCILFSVKVGQTISIMEF